MPETSAGPPAKKARVGDTTLYRLKVQYMMYRKPWQKFVVPAGETLNSLMLAILDAMGYDATHMYEMHFGPKVIADSPSGGIGDEAAHSLTVGDMNLFEDGMFRIIYDMGDNHEMLVTVEGVEKGEPGSLRELAETGDKTRIQHVQSRGKIFPQYGGAEEGSEESAEEEEDDDSEEGDDDEDDFGSDVTSESGEVQYDDDSEDE